MPVSEVDAVAIENKGEVLNVCFRQYNRSYSSIK